MKVSYIRVSTIEQNTNRQENNLKSYIDRCSGSIAFEERKHAKKLISDVEDGKVTEIQIHSLDRLGRNTVDILKTVEYFTSKNINVISEKEGISTITNGKENPVAKMLIGILGTLAEFELNRLKERQAEGIANAKKKGVYIGRSIGSTESEEVFLNKSKVQEAKKHLHNGESLRRAALLSKTSINTVRKLKAILEGN